MNNKIIVDDSSTTLYTWRKTTRVLGSSQSRTFSFDGGNISYSYDCELIRDNDDIYPMLKNPTTRTTARYQWDIYPVVRYNVALSIAYEGSATSRNVWYSQNLVYDNGVLDLYGVTSGELTTSPTSYTTRQTLEALKGKYFKLQRDADTVYYCPSNATLTFERYTTTRWAYVLPVADGGQRVAFGTKSTVTSYIDSKYPTYGFDDNKEYFYRRTPQSNTYLVPEIFRGRYWSLSSDPYMVYWSDYNTTWTDDDAGNVTLTNTSVIGTTSSTITSLTNDYPADGYEGNAYYRLLSSPAESITITDSHLFGGVKYKRDVNGDDDLQVGTVASAEIKFTCSDMNYNYLNKSLTYQVKQTGDSSFRNVGGFIVTDIKKSSGGKYTITAYDNISKFDAIVDSWLDTMSFPTTLGNFFSSLCTYCGCTAASTTFTNSTMTIRDNFTGINITGKKVLLYIAEAAGGFIIADSNSRIAVKNYVASSATLDNSKYTEYTFADYTVPQIQRVWVGHNENDIGTVSGPGPTTLNIMGNPLFLADTAGYYQTQVDNIYNLLSTIVYVPGTVKTYYDYLIDVGDIIYVDENPMLIMSKEWDATGVTFSCTGELERKTTNGSQNEAIEELRGQYLDISADVGQLQIEAGNLAQGLSQTVRIKADGVTITNAAGDTLTIDGGCVDATTINTRDLNMTGTISWGDLENDVKTTIEQSGKIYRQHTVPVNPPVGALWFVTEGNVVIGSVTYYKDSWYSWTGTQWEYSSSPYYITYTSIDNATVKSPTIEGNNIVVNAEAGGSFQLKKNGTGKGFVGVGSAYDKDNQLREGIVVANNADGQGTYLDNDDYYLIVTPAGARIQVGEASIYLDNTGAYVQDINGNIEQLGWARFA